MRTTAFTVWAADPLAGDEDADAEADGEAADGEAAPQAAQARAARLRIVRRIVPQSCARLPGEVEFPVRAAERSHRLDAHVPLHVGAGHADDEGRRREPEQHGRLLPGVPVTRQVKLHTLSRVHVPDRHGTEMALR